MSVDNDAIWSGRVLAVRGGALGDFVLTMPSLRALQRAGAEVQLLTRPAYGRLAVDAGLVSGWRSLEAPEAGALMTPGTEVSRDWHEWLAGFDRVVSWLPDPDGSFQKQIRRAGVREFCQGDWRCVGEGLAAGQLAAVLPDAVRRVVSLTESFFRRDPKQDRRPWIGFHPGSGSVRKNWPLPRWVEVMVGVQETNPEVVWRIFSGEAEEEKLAGIFDTLTKAGLRWESVHGLPLTDLVKALQDCRLFLGHDSGTSHLAAAAGVPCRLLFGPTDPAVWRPAGSQVNVLQAPHGSLELLAPEAVKELLRTDFPGLAAAG